MPYDGEFAQYKSLKRLVQSERVNMLLGSYSIQKRDEAATAQHLIFQRSEQSEWQASLVIAIDGSHLEVDIENGFPGAEASYITMACVVLDIAKVRELDQQRPVNPKDFRDTQSIGSVDCALPGCNVICDNETSAESSFRKALYNIFQTEHAFQDGESLLETYETLLSYKPQSATDQKCPYDDCLAKDSTFYRDKGAYTCRCIYNRPLYSTDALRIHEGMIPFGKNGAMYAEVSQVLERIWIVHVLRALEAKNWLSTLRRLAIVLDGPLAVFGHPAWLAPAISKELNRINKVAKQVNNGQDILLLGIEKTGLFSTHLNYLDQHTEGGQGKISPQSLGLISDSYIKHNIVPTDSTKPYGQDTYFGRKFFYKTKTGALIVGSLPFLEESHKDVNNAEAWQYPRLTDAVKLLDDVFSQGIPTLLFLL